MLREYRGHIPLYGNLAEWLRGKLVFNPAPKVSPARKEPRRRDADNAPMDWNCNVYMDIDIDRTNPTRIVAQVVGDLATIRIEAETANQCRTGMTWRAVMSQAGSPSLETALLVGTFERNDGK